MKDDKFKKRRSEGVPEMSKELGGDLPSPIAILVKYSPELERLTGKSEEKMYLSQGALFVFLLSCIFQSYPQIPQTYDPGKLGFLLDGKPPQNFTPLLDGDTVEFMLN